MAKDEKKLTPEQQVKELQQKLQNTRQELDKFRTGEVIDATQLGDKHDKSFVVLGLGKNAGHMVEKVIPRAFDEPEAIRQYAVMYGIQGEEVSTFRWRVRQVDKVPLEDEKEVPVKQAA